MVFMHIIRIIMLTIMPAAFAYYAYSANYIANYEYHGHYYAFYYAPQYA